jgi:hypothetical protein
MDWFGVSWSGWFPGMPLPFPYQEIIDGVAVLFAPLVWVAAGYFGFRARALYLRYSIEWQKLDEEAVRNST